MTRRGLIAWFAAVLALSALARLTLPGARADRCRLDGVRITPVYRVDLMQDGEVLASFCCVRCATEWPDVPTGSYWRVRDEITGEPLDAATACFVESDVVTVASRQDRTHVFGSWADAMTHAAEYDGRRIANPLGAGDDPAPRSGSPPAVPPPTRDEDGP